MIAHRSTVWTRGETVWKKLNTAGSLPPGYTIKGGGGGPNIACAANDANRVYMAWDRGFFHSDNRGDSWENGSVAPEIHYMNSMENPQPQRGCDTLRGFSTWWSIPITRMSPIAALPLRVSTARRMAVRTGRS